jgi:hypothetical protein
VAVTVVAAVGEPPVHVTGCVSVTLTVPVLSTVFVVPVSGDAGVVVMLKQNTCLPELPLKPQELLALPAVIVHVPL